MTLKRAALCVLISALTFGLAGCGGGKDSKRENQTNTFGDVNNGIYLYRNLSVEDCHIYSFEKDYYDADEFRTYLQEDVDAYNEAHDFLEPETMVPATDEDGTALETVGPQASEPIAVRVCEKKDKKLYQHLLYATAEDFILYNEEEVTKLGGTALQAGALTDADRSVMEETYTDPDGNAFDLNAVLTGEDSASYRYLLCNFEAYLYGDGEIVALTSAGTYDSENNYVKASAGNTVVVIFRNLQ